MYLFMGSLAVLGVALIAVAVLSPQTPKRLFGDCHPVMLKEECLGQKPGIVLGEVCAQTGGESFFAKAREMYGAVEAMQRAKCAFSEQIPDLVAGMRSPEEMAALGKYSDFVCSINDPSIRADEIKTALERYKVNVSCQ